MDNDFKNNVNENPEFLSAQFGLLKQGEMSIEAYYEKIKHNCEKRDLSSEDTKRVFLNGLTQDNKILAQKIGIELPLEKMVKELENFIGQGDMSIENYYNRIISDM